MIYIYRYIYIYDTCIYIYIYIYTLKFYKVFDAQISSNVLLHLHKTIRCFWKNFLAFFYNCLLIPLEQQFVDKIKYLRSEKCLNYNNCVLCIANQWNRFSMIGSSKAIL